MTSLPYEELSEAERMALDWPPEAVAEFWDNLTDEEAVALQYDWDFWGRPKQHPPEGDWGVWNLRAGRGFGKTRSGAEWVHQRAMEIPGEWVALVGKIPADVRDLMIEGPGGILRNTHPDERPLYEPSKRRLVWPNGSWATAFSSEEPDGLRGFSGGTAWLDELLKYRNPREVWDSLAFGMREATTDRPRRLITSTPRPHPLLEEIEADEDTVVVVGSSYENRGNLAPEYYAKTIAKYEGTELYDQEVLAKILDTVRGQVYSSFSRKPWPEGNIDEDVADVGGELLVGMDFNVNPMSLVLGVRVVDELHIFDAWEVDSSHTDEVAQALRAEYPERRIIVCPDPTGKARKTSAAGKTDFTILESYGMEVDAPSKAPAVVDRVNATNMMFLSGGRRRLRIHPRAAALVRSLYGLTYKEGTSIVDKASGYDHLPDALGYLVWRLFNLLEDLTPESADFKLV